MKHLIFLAIILASCSPQKRLARLVEKHPELVGVDTVWQDVAVPFPVAQIDTVVKFTTDTIRLENERLKIEVVTDYKYIKVKGECRADTILVRVPARISTVRPVKTEYVRKPTRWQSFQLFIFHWLVVVVILFAAWIWFKLRK